jgi:hypothetical protein
MKPTESNKFNVSSFLLTNIQEKLQFPRDYMFLYLNTSSSFGFIQTAMSRSNKQEATHQFPTLQIWLSNETDLEETVQLMFCTAKVV